MKMPSKWLFYPVYILALTAFCLYYLFPTDTVSSYLRYRAGQALPGCRLTVERAKPSFPPGLSLGNVTIVREGRDLLQIEHLRVAPALLTLLRRTPSIVVNAKTCGGTIDSRIRLDPAGAGRFNTVDADLKDIALEKVDWLKTVSNRKISGVLSGKVLYNSQARQEQLRAAVMISGLVIELLVPVFNMASLAFHKAEIDIALRNEQLVVKRCVLHGKKIDGNLAGSLKINRPFEKSTFNLSGTVQLHPGFKQELKNSLPAGFFAERGSGRHGFPVRLFGSLDNPRFSLK
jgi:type II secretion system protein N